MSKQKYYDIVEDKKRLEKEGKCALQYFICTSQRSTGKTYSFLYNALKDYFDSGEVNQCAYVRRWGSDFDGNIGARVVYNSLLCNANGENVVKTLSKGKYDSIEYKAGMYYLGKYDDDTGKVDWFRNKVVCYGFSMNNSERIKGGSFPNVMSIGIDEFLTTNAYLTNEFSAMQSIVSTIVRDRTNVTVYLMANNVSFMGYPCWDDWGFQDEVKKIQKGESKIFSYENGMKVGFVWLDMNSRREKPSESNIYFGFNSAASKMITSGDWELPSYPHLPDSIEIRPKDIMFEFFVKFRNELLHCQVCDRDDSRFTFIHKKTTPIKDEEEDIVYTDLQEEAHKPNYSYGLNQKNDKLHRKIYEWLTVYPIYFESNLTGYFFTQYKTQTK